MEGEKIPSKEKRPQENPKELHKSDLKVKLIYIHIHTYMYTHIHIKTLFVICFKIPRTQIAHHMALGQLN